MLFNAFTGALHKALQIYTCTAQSAKCEGGRGVSHQVPVRCKPHDPVMPLWYNRKQLAAADELL